MNSRNYTDVKDKIPWRSFGRKTVASDIALSLLPVGVLPFKPKRLGPGERSSYISSQDSNFEQYLMNIVGTAIQADKGKLVTCAHVVEAVSMKKKPGYILGRTLRDGLATYVAYPIAHALKYLDPRTEKVNSDVDLAILIVPAKDTEEHPYGIPNISWADSSQLGIGDQVIIGGYPLGENLFQITRSNRNIIQPTFYNGIVSAILPATNPTETRVIQVSIPVPGGMSGGAMFDPNTGKVLGMVTSGIDINGIPQPMTYVLPSEVIEPYVDTITFKTEDESEQ